MGRDTILLGCRLEPVEASSRLQSMMQMINPLLGRSASGRHVGSTHRVEGAVGSRKTEEAQPESGSTCWWGRSHSGSASHQLYVQIWLGGSAGLETGP